MPWRNTMSERIALIAAVVAQELRMADACRRAGVSRKTGYKWLQRYQHAGPTGLNDRSRAPHHSPQTLDAATTAQVLAIRATHPTWGPRKVVSHLAAVDQTRAWPAPSTVGDLLARRGLTIPRQRRAHAPPHTRPLAHADGPNAVWCADFKGSFRTGEGTRCSPLTITEAYSRYLLRCTALTATDTASVQPLFEASFREFGLPVALRTDNGPPVASTGAGGLTSLSVWWVRLGILPDRIRPGKPQENGRHERLHRTLKAETAAPPARSLRQQQHAFDRFQAIYNHLRPHEALAQTPPAQHYTPAPRSFPRRLPELVYPDTCEVRRVRQNGQIRVTGD